MAQFLAPIINEQIVDSNGAPLSGGLVFVYLAGTSTSATTYSDKAGLVPNTNPVVLNTLGLNNQGAVWLTGGATYKFVVQNSLGIVQRTIDNVSGINDNAVAASDQWVAFQGTPTFVSTTSFTVAGDQTQVFQVGRRLKTTNTGGTIYSTITASVYGSPNTTVTVANSTGVLDSGLSAVSYGVISPQDTSLPVPYPGLRNLVVNGNFAINQRVYVNGAATTVANQVTLDRWRVVVSGQNITFVAGNPDRTVFVPAGGLEQVIEAGWVVGGPYVLSWVGTAAATVNGVAIANGAQSASLPANTAVTIRFSSGSVGLVQFEPTYITPFERRPPALEMLLCQREYCKSYALGTTPGTSTSSSAAYGAVNVGGTITTNIRLPTIMRVAPTVVVWSNTGVVSQWVAFTAGAVATSYAATTGATDTSITIQSAVAGGEILMTGQWSAATGF